MVEDALSVKLSSSSKTSAGIKLGTQKDDADSSILNNDADSSILNDDALIKIEDVDMQADQPPSSKIDFETVIMGEMLTDVHINLAQTLLKSQFDQLNGLNNTLYQARKVTLTKDTVANKLSARSHWIVATTVKCTPGTVKVYDSVFNSVDDETLQNLFQVYRWYPIAYNYDEITKTIGHNRLWSLFSCLCYSNCF